MTDTREREIYELGKAALLALVRYAGPTDDPGVGWRGRSNDPNLFSCERCHATHEDCTLIPHKEGCSASEVLAVLKKAKEFAHD